MSESLAALAKKAEGLSLFLASVLSAYARSENLDDASLAVALGCRVEDLVMLRLCGAPRMEASVFWTDITQIAQHFKIDPYTLASIVKRGRVIVCLQDAESPGCASEAGLLMAARDREDEPPQPSNEDTP